MGICSQMEKENFKMKIQIRKTKISDAKELCNLINHKDVIKQLVGYPYPCPLIKIKKDISKGLTDWKKKKAFAFTIFADKKIVGHIILENPDKHKTHYEVGYFIGKNYWKKGIATKAVKEILKFGFKNLKLKRIWGSNDSDNPASGRVLEKAGFKLEGRLRKHAYKKRKYNDVLIWGKINN